MRFDTASGVATREPSYSRTPTRGANGGTSTTTSITPMKTIICLIIAAVLYAFAAILILSANCPFSRNVSYYFVFLMLGEFGIILMVIVNLAYPRYRINCMSQSVIMFYCGSSFLIIFMLLHVIMVGLCKPGDRKDEIGVFMSDNGVNVFIWLLTAIGVTFQVVAHYFYG